MIVGVDQQRAGLARAREVNLEDARGIERGERGLGIGAVIVRVHQQVVEVEQDAAVGLTRNCGEELAFAHAVVGEAHVARDVLDRDAAAEPRLHLANARGHVPRRFLGVRQRQQIVEMRAAVRGPAQVIREPGGLEALGERSEFAEVVRIERVAGAEIERDAVQHERRAFAHFAENAQRAPARN